MSTDGTRIEIRGIPVEIVRKDITHLHLGVYSPEGRTRRDGARESAWRS